MCSVVFEPVSGNQKYCSVKCRAYVERTVGHRSTAAQYRRVSGNWVLYLRRLCHMGNKRKNLSVVLLLETLAKQNFKCALSGEPLTCKLESGTVSKTNASIDRIDAGGPYTAGNIQLVCSIVNNLRVDMTVDEFIDWCRKVADYAVQKQSGS